MGGREGGTNERGAEVERKEDRADGRKKGERVGNNRRKEVQS